MQIQICSEHHGASSLHSMQSPPNTAGCLSQIKSLCSNLSVILHCTHLTQIQFHLTQKSNSLQCPRLKMITSLSFTVWRSLTDVPYSVHSSSHWPPAACSWGTQHGAFAWTSFPSLRHSFPYIWGLPHWPLYIFIQTPFSQGSPPWPHVLSEKEKNSKSESQGIERVGRVLESFSPPQHFC